MVRKKTNLTQMEQDRLKPAAKLAGKKQGVIRKAVEQRNGILDSAAGMLKNRIDLPDFDALRRSWDRR